ncbi:MAG TPA: DNA polymerase III subunit gamma/tau [Gemmatimonadaceae bacterium]|nr:DNA polymerase III subunit gamma/tau [Gemmatimonadaceae bacterium]
MALALARKYRPKSFADVAAQSHVSNTLKGAIALGRVAHGYLLCGPRGVGKTTLARVLAMALNCERRTTEEPCGECPSCLRIWSGASSLDVVEIDAASNRGVDDARDLRERAMYAPTGEHGYKVYIVDEAHMLTREAWNALLKILEEPPPRVVFVFATTEPQKIAQTAAPVLSRLQRFDFRRMSAADIRARLAIVLDAEQIVTEPEALSTIARAADGSMRDALSLADQVLSMGPGTLTVERVREALGLVPEEEYIAILDLISDRKAAEVFPAVGRLADAGIDFGAFLSGLADMLRAQLALALGGEPGGISERARTELEARRERLSAADLLRMLGALAELEPRLRKSGQQQLLLETLLVRFALLDRTLALEEVLRGLGRSTGGTEESARGGAPRASASAGGGGGGVTGSSPGNTGGSRGEPAVGLQDEATGIELGTIRDQGPRGGGRSAALGAAEEGVGGGGAGSGGAAVAMASPRASRVAGVPARPLAAAPLSTTPPMTLAAVPLADAAAPPDPNILAERWDEIIDRVRSAGRSTLAAALQHALPAAITARGVVTVRLDEPNEIYQQAFERGREEVTAAARAVFSGITQFVLAAPEGSAPAAPTRLTEESARAERLALLRRRDPALDAAVEALDLELLD